MMKPPPPFKRVLKPSFAQQRNQQLQAIGKEFADFLKHGRYSDALACCQRAIKLSPNTQGCYNDAALCLTHLRRWEEAIEYSKAALRLGKPILSTLDLLSQCYGELGQFDETRKWGMEALNARLRLFDGPAVMPHNPAPLPPAPSAATREQNIIAFSLFGGSPKYCETAILNVQARAQIYPDWTCRFYVDETVPAHVIARLDVPGSRVIQVPPGVKKWPGPMWRFFAYDTPNLHRVIFRDADSVISEREAKAVTEWIAGGQLFHHMRDFQTHTELLLAGLWGCVGGSLPPMHLLVQEFLRAPLESEHFADQFFLRKFVWPYARASLMQHDSLFGFLDPLPFPDGPHQTDFHVGLCEAGGMFAIPLEAPDGTRIDWTLVEKYPVEREICTYTSAIRDNRLFLELPIVWANAYMADQMSIRYKLHM